MKGFEVKDNHPDYRKAAFQEAGHTPHYYDVYWHGQHVATMSVNGQVKWSPTDPVFDSLLGRHQDSRDLPTTFTNLNPRVSFLGGVLGVDTRQEYFSGPEQVRLLANMTLVRQDDEVDFVDPICVDTHNCTIADYDSNMEFTGRYNGLWGFTNDHTFRTALQALWVDRIDHRFSGMQIKIPYTQDSDGSLHVTDKSSFTHIIKLTESGLDESKSILEAACLSVCAAMGVETSKHSLVRCPKGDYPPALVVERYDIPSSNDEGMRFLQQDFYVLNGLDPSIASDVKALSVEDLFKTVVSEHKKHNMNGVQESVKHLIGRVMASYLCNDDDMHAKNVSMLYQVDKAGEVTLSLSPAYDITCDVISEYGTSETFLSLNQHHADWDADDFLALLEHEDIAPYLVGPEGAFSDIDDLKDYLKDISEKAAERAMSFVEDTPDVMLTGPNVQSYHEDLKIMASFVVERAQQFGAEVETPQWDQELWQNKRCVGAGRRDPMELKTILDGVVHSSLLSTHSALQQPRQR